MQNEQLNLRLLPKYTVRHRLLNTVIVYKSPAAPLYYAALCGFYDLVEHLIFNYPKDVNVDGAIIIDQ
jgi:hypothetical protein